jgi:hypothetical protein
MKTRCAIVVISATVSLIHAWGSSKSVGKGRIQLKKLQNYDNQFDRSVLAYSSRTTSRVTTWLSAVRESDEIELLSLKRELSAYLEKRKESGADERAKGYVSVDAESRSFFACHPKPLYYV